MKKTNTWNASLVGVLSLLNFLGYAGPPIEIHRGGSNIVVSFGGDLQTAPNVEGPYRNVLGATNPYVQPASAAPQRFWRARTAGVSAFAAGPEYSVAIKADGTLWAWGQNENGQLGTGGDYFTASEPQQVGTDSNWVAVTCGLTRAAALKADGTIWQWGGVRTNQPVQLGAQKDWVAVASGAGHFAAIRTDGSLWTWGGNRHGQLGNGTFVDSLQPGQVGSETNWLSVVAGFEFTVAIKTDGSLWAWGDNDGFANDAGEFISTNQPMRFGTANSWHSIARGFMPSLIVTTDGFAAGVQRNGTIWAWGYNKYGQLGNGTYDSTNQPVQVGADNDWAAVACGTTHTLALKADGSLWGWGRNGLGMLGDGLTYTRTNMPVRCGQETDWIAVACGSHHSLGLKVDGTLWAWGSNYYGELGTGTGPTNRPTPVTSVGRWAQ